MGSTIGDMDRLGKHESIDLVFHEKPSVIAADCVTKRMFGGLRHLEKLS
ncbi:MAG: hypothetical protein ABL921_17130 [Pirellula sp.]